MSDIEALDECIRILRQKDRWRLRKRNKGAIKTLETTRDKVEAAQREAKKEAQYKFLFETWPSEDS